MPPTAFSFDPQKINTEAQHWIRWRLGDTKDKRVLAHQDTIIAILALHGLLATSAPATNMGKLRKAAIDVCRGIIATIAQDSETTITEVGPIKSQAAEEMRKVLMELEQETATASARPRFFNPGEYAVGHIADVDPLPDAES